MSGSLGSAAGWEWLRGRGYITPAAATDAPPPEPPPVVIEPHISSAPKDGYVPEWDGSHCPFAYTHDTVTAWPPCPRFKEEE